MITRSEAEYDLRGLTELVSSLNGALLANGHDGDLHRILKIEAGQLAWDISRELGPKTKHQNDDKVKREIGRFLTDRPKYSNLSADQQYSSTADFTWLQAGPNFLLGINDEDDRRDASGAEALTFLRAGQNTGSRGKAYVELGVRGKQHVYRLNRTRVSTSAKRSVFKAIQDRFGTLRASFALAAARWIPGKMIPEFVSRHFPSNANGRGIINESGLNHPTEPFLEFGSRSPGVESNEAIVETIRGQVQRRKFLVRSKLEKVLRGYAYDWNNGRVFRRREASEEEE